MTATLLACDAAMSDDVLQAARAAMPADPARWFADSTVITRLPEKQQPLVPLLMALLDAAQAVAKAVADNAYDDGRPVDRNLSSDLAKQAQAISADIASSSACADRGAWGMPSMSGKEFV